MKKLYIHYGNEFNRDKFHPIKNYRSWTKPSGGFWASNINSDFGWKDWVEDSEMDDTFSLEKSFIFSLKEGSKVLFIESKEDLKNIPQRKDNSGIMFLPDQFYIDFEKLYKDGWDAVEVKIKNLYWDLYGWDCDSIVIMNPDIIIKEN